MAETQIGLRTYALQLRLPVLNVDLWILRIKVNQKMKVNTSVEADQSVVFRVPYDTFG